MLVVRVWLHGGIPVARLLSHPPSGPPSDDGTTAAGTAGIVAAMERWVTDLVAGTHGGATPDAGRS